MLDLASSVCPVGFNTNVTVPASRVIAVTKMLVPTPSSKDTYLKSKMKTYVSIGGIPNEIARLYAISCTCPIRLLRHWAMLL